MQHLPPEVPSPPILPAPGPWSGRSGLRFVDPRGRGDRAVSRALNGYRQVKTWLSLAADQQRHMAARNAERVRQLSLRRACVIEVCGEFAHTSCLHTANKSSSRVFAVGNLPIRRFGSTLQTCA